MSDISFPNLPDVIPFYAVGLYGVIGPIIAIVLVELFNSRVFSGQNSDKIKDSRLRQFGICVFHGISLFVFGISAVLLLTEIGKRWIGRLRPNFLAVCKPLNSQINCITSAGTGSIYNSIYTGENFCTGDPDLITNARLSFPSGHSSFSTYTMLFLAIYLEARLFLLRFRYVKTLIQVTAVIAAYVTCISRIGDYHHRGSDVIGGAILGAIVALFFTLVRGRVIWEYNNQKQYSDFDLKNINDQTQQPLLSPSLQPANSLYSLNNLRPNINNRAPIVNNISPNLNNVTANDFQFPVLAANTTLKLIFSISILNQCYFIEKLIKLCKFQIMIFN